MPSEEEIRAAMAIAREARATIHVTVVAAMLAAAERVRERRRTTPPANNL